MRSLTCISLVLCSCSVSTQLRTSPSPSPLPSPSPSSRTGSTPPAAGSGQPPAGACDAQHNHCVRPETWFQVDTAVRPGTSGPAIAVYERDGRWLAYSDDDYARRGYVLRTQVASPATTKAGDVVIVWRPNDDEPPWPESDKAAQTTWRWQAMVVERIDPGSNTFTIEGRPDRAIPIAAARNVVESKEVRNRGSR